MLHYKGWVTSRPTPNNNTNAITWTPGRKLTPFADLRGMLLVVLRLRSKTTGSHRTPREATGLPPGLGRQGESQGGGQEAPVSTCGFARHGKTAPNPEF